MTRSAGQKLTYSRILMDAILRNDGSSSSRPVTAAYCDNSSEYDNPSFIGSSLDTATIIIGVLILAANGLLFRQMYRNRRLLKAKRYTFLANVAVGDFLAGLLLTVSAVAINLGAGGIWVVILPVGTCFNVTLVMCNYTCSMIVQCVALRYPIYYKTAFTKPKIALIISSCWVLALVIFAIGFVSDWTEEFSPPVPRSLSYYPHVDLALKYIHLVGNSLCFLYTLTVAGKRRYKQRVATVAIENGDGGWNKERKESSMKSDASNSLSLSGGKIQGYAKHGYIKHRGALFTAGLRLLVYLIACLPFTAHFTYSMIFEDSSSTNTQLASWACLIWFCRGIADPVITLTREKALALRT